MVKSLEVISGMAAIACSRAWLNKSWKLAVLTVFVKGFIQAACWWLSELAFVQLNGTVAHGLHERMLAEGALDIAQRRALDATWRMEHVLYVSEAQNAFREQIGWNFLTVSIADRHAYHVRNDGERLPVGFEDFLVRVERGHRFACARPQHHLVQVAFDDGVHFRAVLFAEPVDAGIAQGELLRVHQRMLCPIKQVMAQEACNVRLRQRVHCSGQVHQALCH